MSDKLKIDEGLLVDVVRALNIAIGVAFVHAPEVHRKILDTAVKLDDAINDALEAKP